ncbi:hypothetical protein B0H14DRAFT_3165643 [Mycena olivaceomarginata]|nr:hypothetical protein B0H14DRAFT_3165643 [Mycena olivaceomarginata]
MATRGPCRRCPSGDCVAFTTLMQSPSHLTAAPVIAGTLRPTIIRQRKSLSLLEAVAVLLDVKSFERHVLQDTPGHTLCEGIGCGRPWTAHDEVAAPPLIPHGQRPSSSMTMVPSRATPGQLWGQPAPSGTSADHHRRNTALHHRPFGPAVGSTFPRGAHQPYPNSRRLASSTVPTKQPALHELIFVLWPFAMSPQSIQDTEYPDLYPLDPRLFGNEDAHFITTLNRFNLILKFKVPLAPDGTEDREFIFYSQLHDAVMQHFTDHNLRFSAPSPSSALQEPMPSNVHARASVSVSTGPGGPDDLPLVRWVDRVYIVELKLKVVCLLRAALADDTLAKIRPHTLQFDLEHGRASTVQELARWHQARYLSEDLTSSKKEARERSLSAGSAESALGAGLNLLGEGRRAAGLAGRKRDRGTAGRGRGGGGDVFSPQQEQHRTLARVEWADETLGHGQATSMAEYASYDRDRDGGEDGEGGLRMAPPLRTYRSSAFVLDAGRAGSALRRYRDRRVSVERERDDRDRDRERASAPSPSPFGSVAQRRNGSGGESGGGSGQEHTKLMGDSLAMFEGHLARIGHGDRTTHDLAQHARNIVAAAETLNAILRAGTARALEEQIDTEVSGVDRDGEGGGRGAQDLAEVWRRVGGEYRKGLRVSDELVRGVTGFLLGVGKVVRDFGEGGRSDDEGRESASPDAGRDGRRSVESRRSDDRPRGSTGGGRDSALGPQPSSVVNLRHEPTPPARNAALTRRLLTPREQRELSASGGIVASDSQETVQLARHSHNDYDASRKQQPQQQQNPTTLDSSRTLPSISIPKPLPTPSESASTLRRNQTTMGATGGGSAQRRRTITSPTVRAAGGTAGGLLPSSTMTRTTALTPHTVSNSPDTWMTFPTLPRSDSDKSAPGNGRGRNNTVTSSRPSMVALAGMQHERERQRSISGTHGQQMDAAAVAIAAAAGPSRSTEDKDTRRKRSSAATNANERPRMSLDAGGVDSIGRGHPADRSAAAGLSTMNQKRERKRTVMDIWPPSAS